MAALTDTPVLSERLAVRRCAAVGVIVFGVLFVLCWLGATLGWLNSSHMYISLFTNSPVASLAAFGAGLCWSVVFGGLAGALTALSYNALGFLGR